MGAGGEALEMELHVLVQELVVGEQIREPLDLRVVGKIAVNDQIGGLDEIGLFSQFLNGDAAVAQNTLIAIDKGDLAGAGTGVPVAVINGDVVGGRPEA